MKIISVHPGKVGKGEEKCIRIQEGKDGMERWAREVVISGPSKMVMDLTKPLPCGARVWIETESEVSLG